MTGKPKFKVKSKAKFKTKAKSKAKTKVKAKKSRAISGSSFTDAELKKFTNVISKIRKGRKGTRGKKVGIANLSSFMNLLHNASRERDHRMSGAKGRYRAANMMMAHPFKYPSLIQDADVNHIWNATKLPKGKSKDGIITNMNQVYRQLVGFDLLKPPPKRLAKHERGAINVVGPDGGKAREEKKEEPKGPYLMPTKPTKTPQIREAPRLPSRPSRAPPRVQTDTDSSSSDDEEY